VRARRIFQWFTFFLFVLTAWVAWANVLSDDTDVRARARAALGEAAGCGDACKIESLRGDRGMIEEKIEYDVVGRGHFTVVCRRASIAFGEHVCRASKP
jgi:hypothetical protein